MHNQDPPVIHRISNQEILSSPSNLVKLVDFGLVKQMIPDEMTVTVIQGRGTALYTPLEQYGGDTGHTDPRSDIYALGATLYHLVTNHPPVEAKSRFLNPGAFQMPSAFNPSVPSRFEDAILWCMALHPVDRPQGVTSLRSAMLTDTPFNFPSTSIHFFYDSSRSRGFASNQVDRTLLAMTGLLLILALLSSFI